MSDLADFDPTKFLETFDWGRESVDADGRTVREWDVYAADKEIEVAPGVFFPAWTYNGQVPGPTFRCRQGDLLRFRFHNASVHAAHDPLPRHPPAQHGRRDARGADRRRLHLRVRGQAVRAAPLSLPRDAAQAAHPQGPVRHVHHRPAAGPPAGPGDGHGDERLRHQLRQRERDLRGQHGRLPLRHGTRSRSRWASRCASTWST